MNGNRPATRSGDAAPSQYRGGRRNNRGGFRPQAAHERALLQTRNDDTEHFLGVEAKSNKFRDLAELSDEEEADMDVSDDSDKSDGEVVEAQSKTKAIRTQSSSRADGDSVPKWSNPDPYTVLPPPEETTGKRIDFVKLIRKAKNEAIEQSNGVNAVAANDDFISFGDDDDDFQPPAAAPSVLASRAEPLQGSLNDVAAAGSAASADARGRRAADSANLPVRPPPPPSSLPPRPTFTSSSTSSSRKRKHPADYTGMKDVWQPKDREDAAPWAYREDYERLRDQPEKLLHNEISDFYDFVAPTDHDNEVRLDLIRRVQSVIGGEFQSHRGSIRCFGSFPIGLYLPTADMDLVFVSDSHYQGGPPKLNAGKSAMFNLAKKLKFNQVGYETFVIPKARVPIIKFKDIATDLPVDISFENMSGVIAQSTLAKWKKQFGDHFTNLVALIKQLLEMYSLNDNSTGGLGGLSICCLVASFLQLHELPENLGQTFLQFLDFFGNKFDYSRDRIVVDPAGIVRKVSTTTFYPVNILTRHREEMVSMAERSERTACPLKIPTIRGTTSLVVHTKPTNAWSYFPGHTEFLSSAWTRFIYVPAMRSASSNQYSVVITLHICTRGSACRTYGFSKSRACGGKIKQRDIASLCNGLNVLCSILLISPFTDWSLKTLSLYRLPPRTAKEL